MWGFNPQSGKVVWHLSDWTQPSIFEAVLPTGRVWYRRVVWNFSERLQPILLANMNWLGILCKQLAGVKDGEIVKKCQYFWAATHAGWVWKNCVRCLRHISTLAMLLANINWLGVILEEIAGLKDLINVRKIMFPGIPPHEEEGLGGLCEIISTNYLNCGYVVG